MSKLTDFFYIFSKFTTSIILFIILIFTGYALFKSYKGVDNISSKFNGKLTNISNDIKINTSKIINYEKSIDENKIYLKNLKESLSQKKIKEQIFNLENDNKILLKEIKKINNILNNLKIVDNINSNNKVNNFNKDADILKDNNDKQILSLKAIIQLKYEEGRDIEKDIEMLEVFFPNKHSHIFEKLYTIQSNIFYGKEKLKVNFNISLEKYVKHKFISENQNLVLRFLLKYINIKPNKLNTYENYDLNILIRAKKYFDIEEYENSLNQVLSLNDNSTNFFKEWINQISLLVELNKTLAKVK